MKSVSSVFSELFTFCPRIFFLSGVKYIQGLLFSLSDLQWVSGTECGNIWGVAGATSSIDVLLSRASHVAQRQAGHNVLS